MDINFMRPETLWGLILLLPLGYILRARLGNSGDWSKAIDPHLLPHILVDESKRRSFLSQSCWLALPILLLGSAGPSWERAELPVFKRSDAIVIVLDLSDSMWAEDIQPSRIQRAKQKIIDLLAIRNEGLTGLVVFSGDAHVVTPLTDDTRTIANLLPALSPGIMPLKGANAPAAIQRASELIKSAKLNEGQILLITDGLPKINEDQIRKTLRDNGARLDILTIGTTNGAPIPLPDGGFLRDDQGEIIVPRLDVQQIKDVAEKLGATETSITLNDQDIRSIVTYRPNANSIEQSMERRTDTWIDRGYLLAIAAAILLLPLFRRGGLAIFIAGFIFSQSPTAGADVWNDLWATRNQQGQQAMANDDPAAAARLFKDPAWQGTALFKNGNFLEAADRFHNLDTADGFYNQGNALVAAGDLQGALEAYDRSLALSPDKEDAIQNREVVESLLKQRKEQEQKEQDQKEQDQKEQDQKEQDQKKSESNEKNKSKEMQNSENTDQQSSTGEGQQNPNEASKKNQDQSEQTADPGHEGTERNQVGADQQKQKKDLSEETDKQMALFNQALEEQQALEQWLRRVPDDPSGLLERKFRYQTIQRIKNGEAIDETIRW